MNNVQINGYRSLPLCDIHTHLHKEPLNASLSAFRALMDYYGYAAINLACVHRMDTDDMDTANILKGLYLKARLNEDGETHAIVYGNATHFYDERDTAENYLAQVKTQYAMGVDGFKILDGKPKNRKHLGHPLCDPVFDKMYAFFEENGIPVLMHLGDPPHFWGDKSGMSAYGLAHGWWCGDGTFPSLEELRKEIEGILTKFPKLKLCLAHFYFLGHDPAGARAFMEKWENVSLDLAPGGIMFEGFAAQPDVWKRFFADFSHRIFFGTDNTNVISGDPAEYFERSWAPVNLVRRMLEWDETKQVPYSAAKTLTPMHLPREQLDNIFEKNFRRLHPAARPLDAQLIARYASALSKQLQAGNVSDDDPALEIENLAVIEKYFAAL